MPKPTQAEVADLVGRLRHYTFQLDSEWEATMHEAADALEALAGERAEVHIDYPILASTTQEAMGAAPSAKPAGELPQLLGGDDLVANMRGIAAIVEETLGMTRMKCNSGWIDGDGLAVVMRHAADELESAYALRALRERA